MKNQEPCVLVTISSMFMVVDFTNSFLCLMLKAIHEIRGQEFIIPVEFYDPFILYSCHKTFRYFVRMLARRRITAGSIFTFSSPRYKALG